MRLKDWVQMVVFLLSCMLGFYGVVTFIRTTNFFYCLLLASLIVGVSWVFSCEIVEQFLIIKKLVGKNPTNFFSFGEKSWWKLTLNFLWLHFYNDNKFVMITIYSLRITFLLGVGIFCRGQVGKEKRLYLKSLYIVYII